MRQLLKKIVIGVLIFEARLAIQRFNPKVLMVTGSVGKTSTKEAIYTALNGFLKVRKGQKSFNSEIGVPLTILDLDNAWGSPLHWLWNMVLGFFKAVFTDDYPEWLILEVGADRPGDLQNITKWLKPDMVVATRFPDVPPHVEFYLSPEELIKEESAPVFALKSNGILILNDDDEKILVLSKDFRGKVLTYGLTPRANVSAQSDETIYETKNKKKTPAGIRFEVSNEDDKVFFEIHDCLGTQHIYPILAGVATALSLGGELDQLHKAFETHQAPLGRMHVVEGIKGTVIIDDTYNSSPAAAELALLTLKDLKVTGRRIAILGDMRELGSFAKEEHQKIGTLVAKICDILVTVGVQARDIAEGALDTLMDEKNIYQFEESRQAGKFMEGIIRERDIILIKGSESIRMEKTVEELMLHPENKDKLLVRQEREWRNR